MENNKKPVIEFLPGEEYCRYNGVLMDEEGCLKTFGYPEELYFLDDETVVIDDKIYSDSDIADLIKMVSNYQSETPEWDIIFNQGTEPSGVSERRKYDNTYVLSEDSLSIFEDIREILPYSQFKKDYLQISLEEHDKFIDALNDYYDQKFDR